MLDPIKPSLQEKNLLDRLDNSSGPPTRSDVSSSKVSSLSTQFNEHVKELGVKTEKKLDKLINKFVDKSKLNTFLNKIANSITDIYNKIFSIVTEKFSKQNVKENLYNSAVNTTFELNTALFKIKNNIKLPKNKDTTFSPAVSEKQTKKNQEAAQKVYDRLGSIETTINRVGTLPNKIKALEESIDELKQVEKKANADLKENIKTKRFSLQKMLTQYEIQFQKKIQEPRADLLKVGKEVSSLLQKAEGNLSNALEELKNKSETAETLIQDPDLAEDRKSQLKEEVDAAKTLISIGFLKLEDNVKQRREINTNITRFEAKVNEYKNPSNEIHGKITNIKNEMAKTNPNNSERLDELQDKLDGLLNTIQAAEDRLKTALDNKEHLERLL